MIAAILASTIADALISFVFWAAIRPPFYELLFGAYAGVQSGQLVLLAIWGVFSIHPLWVRVLVGVGGAALIRTLPDMVAASTFLPSFHDAWQFAFGNLLLIPAFALAATVLLWPFRLWRGWRIASSAAVTADTRNAEATQFSVRDLFLVTLWVAIALALPQGMRTFDNFDRFATRLLILAGVSFLWSIPSIWFAFEIVRPVVATAFIALFSAMLASLEVKLIFGTFGAAGWLSVFALQLTTFAITVGVLRFIRRWGYVLIRSRRKLASPTAGPPGWKPEWPPSGDTADGK